MLVVSPCQSDAVGQLRIKVVGTLITPKIVVFDWTPKLAHSNQ